MKDPDDSNSREVSVLRRVPGSRRMLVHPDGGRRAARVRTLAGASDWRRDLLDRIGALGVRVAGPHRLPVAPSGWSWPALDSDELTELLLGVAPGLHIQGAVVPRQPGRRRLSILAERAGEPIVVKLGVSEPGASLRVEADVLRLLGRRPLPGIVTPRLLGFEEFTTVDGPIEVLVTGSVALGRQRPALDVRLHSFERDLANRLDTLDPGSSDVSTCRPIHGDLTPWNLRHTARGLALFDWEGAGWGEPGSDLATYRQACDEVRPRWSRR